uniref:Gypsy retrotransposon integrase-like protein 1 n=1 Tax=Latimeria chalumnae TaxID=7897 RepID=H3AC60_LATCH
ICTNFRWLNVRTIKDAHPLPHQADCLAALGGNLFFSTLDLTSRFYNISLHEDDKRYTAFTTPLGLYEYNRLPQGLCNSPGSFMHMMLNIFGDLNFSSLLCYLNDLLIFAPTEEEALNRLRTVFHPLKENLKLAPKKHLMRKTVKLLGHIIDHSGVAVDPAKIEAIVNIKEKDLMEDDDCTPSLQKLKSFLGMVLYYQHFIPDCSAITKPLFSLTAGQKHREWTPLCTAAFEKLKEALLNCVVLAHPDFERAFVLSIDASLDGLGAVLSQVPLGEDKARPVAFASKTLSRAQAKYPAHRLEFLALKWAVCDKFSHWLKGQMSTICTDNNPLTYILTNPKLDVCEQRWVANLAPYNFKIKHIPGRMNVVADALSRNPLLLEVPNQTLLAEAGCLSKDEVSAILEKHIHDLAGHQGQARTLHLARQRLFWPDMSPPQKKKDIKEYVQCCQRCVIGKTPPAARAPFESIKTSAPLELVCIDFWSAEDSNNKSVDVLVITDHFTKLAHAFPCKNQTAKQVAKTLWDRFCVYGFPKHIHSDQGTNFESSLIVELLELAGVDKSHTTAYHPMGNGGTERFNRTLGNMMRSLPPKAKHHWPQMIQMMIFVYNCTTGIAPFYLMFGGVPRLPVDIMFKNIMRDNTVVDYDTYAVSLIRDLQEAMALAQQHTTKEQKHQAKVYNKKIRGSSLILGDRVLL